MKIKLTRKFYILFFPNIWTCYFREFNYFISGRVRNRVWIVGDSIVRRAKERATAQNRLHLGAEKGAVQWHGQGGATLHDLPRMVTNRLNYNAPPALAIVHLGTNDLGQRDACRCRIAIDTAIQTLRARMPGTHIAWSGILPRLFYYGSRPGPTSQEAMDGVRKSLNKFAKRRISQMVNTSMIVHNIDTKEHSLFHRDGIHLSDVGSDMLIDKFESAAKDTGLLWTDSA